MKLIKYYFFFGFFFIFFIFLSSPVEAYLCDTLSTDLTAVNNLINDGYTCTPSSSTTYDVTGKTYGSGAACTAFGGVLGHTLYDVRKEYTCSVDLYNCMKGNISGGTIWVRTSEPYYNCFALESCAGDSWDPPAPWGDTSGCDVPGGGDPPPPPTCAESGGSCYAGSCPDEDTDLGTGYSDCGGWNCCVPPPPPPPTCSEVNGTCKSACGAGENAWLGATGCGFAESCCVPYGVTINVNVFNDLNRNMARDTGETGAADIPIFVRLFGSSVDSYTGITDSNGRHSFINIPKNLYNVIITVPANYEVVGGTNSKLVNGFSSSVNVNFPIAPLGRSISDSIIVVADTDGRALGNYGFSGLRTNESGDNYYNAIKITQKIDVLDQTNRDKVTLIGTAFIDSAGAIPTTLNDLKTKANSSGGFILVYARDFINNPGLGGPVSGLAGCFLYNFCSRYYYLYFNSAWYGVNATSTFYPPYPTTTINKTTIGIKLNVSGNNNSIPTTYPGVISVPFTTYMFKIMGSKQWATYGFMYDSDGIQYVRRQKACDGLGNCTVQ